MTNPRIIERRIFEARTCEVDSLQTARRLSTVPMRVRAICRAVLPKSRGSVAEATLSVIEAVAHVTSRRQKC
jgi:hypothetical protein